MSNHSTRVDLSSLEFKTSGHASKYDWVAMKADYLSNRHLTLDAIATKYGCSHLSVKKHSASENWINDRAAINRESIRATTEANVRRQAKSQLQFNEDCLAESISLLSSLKDEHERLKSANELKASDIDRLASGLERLQKAGRLALGLSTGSSEVTGKDGKSLMGDKTLDEVTAELLSVIGEEAFNVLNGAVDRSSERARSSADLMLEVDLDEEDEE